MNDLAHGMLEQCGLPERGVAPAEMTALWGAVSARQRSQRRLLAGSLAGYAAALICGASALAISKFYVVTNANAVMGAYEPGGWPTVMFRILMGAAAAMILAGAVCHLMRRRLTRPERQAGSMS